MAEQRKRYPVRVSLDDLEKELDELKEQVFPGLRAVEKFREKIRGLASLEPDEEDQGSRRDE